MKKKKIIAREFLLLLSCFLVFGLAFIFTYPYNYFLNQRANNLENKINDLSEELIQVEAPIRRKISNEKWLYEMWQKNLSFDYYESYSKMWDRLRYLQESDSIQYKWDNVWSESVISFLNGLGFINAEQFDKFIYDNLLDNDELLRQREGDNIRSQISENEKKNKALSIRLLDFDEQKKTALLFLLVSVIIIFPIRLLYYAVAWSIRTLREKGE